jgi:hypothetical protein
VKITALFNHKPGILNNYSIMIGIKHFQSIIKTMTVYMILIHGSLTNKSSIENYVNIRCLTITRYEKV